MQRKEARNYKLNFFTHISRHGFTRSIPVRFPRRPSPLQRLLCRDAGRLCAQQCCCLNPGTLAGNVHQSTKYASSDPLHAPARTPSAGRTQRTSVNNEELISLILQCSVIVWLAHLQPSSPPYHLPHRALQGHRQPLLQPACGPALLRHLFSAACSSHVSSQA